MMLSIFAKTFFKSPLKLTYLKLTYFPAIVKTSVIIIYKFHVYDILQHDNSLGT